MEGELSLEQLHNVREYEFSLIRKHLPAADPKIRILEIGAGTGQQAAELSALGYTVTAIDMPSSAYAEQRIYPIQDYDGRTLPVPDASVDVVFSSNVLEHVVEIHGLLKETARVLKPEGMAIHVMPTSAWRILTTLTYYPWLAKRFFQIVFFSKVKRHDGSVAKSAPTTASALSTLWQKKHGERGNLFTETWYFSEYWWCKTFRETGFRVECVEPSGVAYSGSCLLADQLGVENRKMLSPIFGSSTKIYVVKKSLPVAQ